VILKLQATDCALRQIQCRDLEAGHSRSGPWEFPAAVEAGLVCGEVHPLSGLERRIAVFNAGSLNHALKDPPRSLILQGPVDEVDERLMHVVIGHRSSDPVYVCDGHTGLVE
jgi:hypothetical protein